MNIANIENDQLDLMARPGIGAQRKEKALSDHEAHKSAAIKWLRGQLRSLYNDRAFGYAPRIKGTEIASVTADDARRIYDASSFPKAYSVNRSFYGALFRSRDWQLCGQRVQSLHPSNHARKIECYRYVGP